MLHNSAIITVYHLVAPRVPEIKKSGREIFMEVALEEAAWVVLHIVIPIIVSILVGLGFDGAYHLPFEGAENASTARESVANTSESAQHISVASDARSLAVAQPTAAVRTVYIVVEKGSSEWNTLVSQAEMSQVSPCSHCS